MTAAALWTEWWSQFIPSLDAAQPGWLRTLAPPSRNYLHLPSGRSGALYSVTFRRVPGLASPHLQVSLWMDDASRWWPVLLEHREQIDHALGDRVIWDPLEGRKAAHIVISYGPADPADRDSWADCRAWAIENVIALRRVLQPIMEPDPALREGASVSGRAVGQRDGPGATLVPTVRVKPRRRTSVPQAKNVMMRAMREILDPSPLDVGPVWDHFESRCAYCDTALDIAGRSAHIDHAEAARGNHLGNLVLACGSCNGDQKREMPWREFVASKAATERDAAARIARIEAWTLLHPRAEKPIPPEALRLAEEIRALTREFSTKCAELRTAMNR